MTKSITIVNYWNFILPDRNEPMDVSNSFPDPEVQDDYQNAPKEKAGIGAAAAVQDTQAAVQDTQVQEVENDLHTIIMIDDAVIKKEDDIIVKTENGVMDMNYYDAAGGENADRNESGGEEIKIVEDVAPPPEGSTCSASWEWDCRECYWGPEKGAEDLPGDILWDSSSGPNSEKKHTSSAAWMWI